MLNGPLLSLSCSGDVTPRPVPEGAATTIPSTVAGSNTGNPVANSSTPGGASSMAGGSTTGAAGTPGVTTNTAGAGQQAAASSPTAGVAGGSAASEPAAGASQTDQSQGGASQGAADVSGCDQGSFQGKNYLLCPYKGVDWFAARDGCKSGGADLVKLDSAEEEAWVYGAIPDPGSIWIGANDTETEGDFRWLDGSSVSAGYTAWEDGQPNDNDPAGEDCAVMHSTMGGWNDVRCDTTAFDPDPMSFVCEFP